MKRFIVGFVLALLGSKSFAQSNLYWRTDGTTGGTWTSASWNNGSATPTGGTGWTSGANAFFTASSSLAYVTSTAFGNVTVSNGAAITITAAGTASAGAHIYDIGTGSTLTWASQNYTASGTSFIKNGGGTWDAGSIGNAFTGGFTLNAGTVVVSGNNSLGAGSLTINGGTIQSSGTRAFAPTSITVGGDFALTGTGTSSWGANVNLGNASRTISNTAVGSGVTRTFAGVISGTSGSGLTISGTGSGTASSTSTTILSGANTYDGGTTLASGGILQLAGGGTLGATSGSLTVNAGRLDLNGTHQTVGNLSGNGGTIVNNSTGTAVTLTIGAGNATGGNYQGVLANNTAGTGTLAVSKSGSGTLTLSGANTYSGGTTINNGTLKTGHNAALGTGSVTVNSGGTLSLGSGFTHSNAITVNSGGYLAGSGTTSGATTVASGGYLSPGNSPGVLNNSGTLNLNSGSIYNWELASLTTTSAGTHFDQILNTGSIVLTSGALINLVFGATLAPDRGNAFWNANQSWTVIANGGGGTITGTALSLNNSQTSWSSLGTFSTTLSNNELTLNWTTVSAVPEPSSYALLAGAVALFGVAVHRRRAHAAKSTHPI